jgi:hypothetical protein
VDVTLAVMFVGFALVACGKAYNSGLSPRPFEIMLAFWIPFFLFYVAVVWMPGVHDLSDALGLAAWVADYDEAWRVLLAFTFGVISGGWLGTKLSERRAGRA